MIAEAGGPPALCELLAHHPRDPQQAAAEEPESSKGHPCPGCDHLCFPIPVLGRGCGPCRAALECPSPPLWFAKGRVCQENLQPASHHLFIGLGGRQPPGCGEEPGGGSCGERGAAERVVTAVGGLEEVQRLSGVCVLDTWGSNGKPPLHPEMAVYESVDRGKYKEMAASQDEVKGRGDSPWDGRGWLCVETAARQEL